jgi:hypothetical protein
MQHSNWDPSCFGGPRVDRDPRWEPAGQTCAGCGLVVKEGTLDLCGLCAEAGVKSGELCERCRQAHWHAEESDPGFHNELRKEQDEYEQAQKERQAQAKKRPEGK